MINLYRSFFLKLVFSLVILSSFQAYSGLLNVTDFSKLCNQGFEEVKSHLDQLKQENSGDIRAIINQNISGLDTGFNTNYLHQAIQRTHILLVTERTKVWMSDRDSVRIVQLLLENGAEPNQATLTGQLPIYRAIYARNPDVVRILIQHGANLSLVNQTGLNVFEYTTRLIKESEPGNRDNLYQIYQILQTSNCPEPSPMAGQAAQGSLHYLRLL